MDSVTANVARAYPKSNKGWGAFVDSFQSQYVDHDTRFTLWLLLGGLAHFFCLSPAVNVANLLLARGMSRQKEIAVRNALGASKKTIFLQMLTESLVLAITGGALGVAVGYAILRVLIAIMPQYTLPTGS